MRLDHLVGTLFLQSWASFIYAYTTLSDASLGALPDAGHGFDIHKGELLAPILQVRIPGTPGAERVRKHFVSFFKANLPDWTITFQNSTQPTALNRNIFFSNLVVSRDPPWTRQGDAGRLTLVAHYDSKMEPKGFIGATDSAAPCAMLMHVARSIDEALTMKWAQMQRDGEDNMGDEQGVQIFFLDGEEALVDWTHEDSIYGAKALAEQLDKRNNHAMSTYRTGINEITLFVLLDLLGAPDPSVPSYFQTTHWAYQHMAVLETRLRGMRRFKSSPLYGQKAGDNGASTERPWLKEGYKARSSFWMGGFVEDDHLPFFHRGVEVLHLIPSPFPAVWHRMQDDGEHLDINAVQDWAQLVTAFTAEWMDLEGFMPRAVDKEMPRDVYKEKRQEKTEL